MYTLYYLLLFSFGVFSCRRPSFGCERVSRRQFLEIPFLSVRVGTALSCSGRFGHLSILILIRMTIIMDKEKVHGIRIMEIIIDKHVPRASRRPWRY